MNYIIRKVNSIKNANLYALVSACLILVLPTAVLVATCLITAMLAIKLNTMIVLLIPTVVGICTVLWIVYLVTRLDLA